MLRKAASYLAATMLAMAGAFPGLSLAQNYPTRAIRVIVGYGAGGIADLLARVSSDEMGRVLGQPFVVENRPGGNAAVAANAVRIAAPDGYTLYQGPTVPFSRVYVKEENAIDATKVLTPISYIAAGEWIVYVTASLPVQNLQELTAYAKGHPLRLASPSMTNNLLMAMISKRLGFTYENVSYKTSDQTIASLLAGDTQATLNAYAGFGSFLSSGKLRAISTLGSKRAESLPNVPTATEQGLALEAYATTSLWGPLGLPADVVGKLNAAAVEALKAPAVVEKFRNVSYSPVSSSPAELVRRTEAEAQLLNEATKQVGYVPQ
jgi:tripartite-type tricarboxylate transporter receptor subunit TctC